MTSLGHIVVQVFASRAAVPVVGATVAITVPGSGEKPRLLASLTTDQSGRTPPVALEAPPQWESQAPGEEAPFALCDIRVAHPGYQLALIEGVQVFAGLTTLQPVLLLPLPQHATPGEFYRPVHITPQPL